MSHLSPLQNSLFLYFSFCFYAYVCSFSSFCAPLGIPPKIQPRNALQALIILEGKEQGINYLTLAFLFVDGELMALLMEFSFLIFFPIQALCVFLSVRSSLFPFISAFFLLIQVPFFFFLPLSSSPVLIHLQNLLEEVFLIIFLSINSKYAPDFFFIFIFSRFL